MQVFPVLN